MRFNEFNTSKIEEGPLANKVGSAIGKTVGTVAKGVGAVAGGIAGIKGAVKKGFQAGKTTVAGGGDEPATATTPATGTAPQPAAAPATATPAAAPATGTAPQPAAAPAQPAAKPGATAEPKKKLSQFGAFKQGFDDEMTAGTVLDTAEKRREKEKAANKIAPPTKGTTVGTHQYDGKQWVDTKTNTPVDKKTAASLQKKYHDEQMAKSPASSASGTPSAAGTPASAGAPAAAGAATPTAAGTPASAGTPSSAGAPASAGTPAADAAPQVDIKSISTQIASANLPAINALMKSLDIDPNEKPSAAPAAKPAATAPAAKPAATAPAQNPTASAAAAGAAR